MAIEKFFNTTGPVIEGEHYCLSPLSRIDWEEIQYLIDTKRYFVFHAPRQTGKTSTLKAMVAALEASGKYAPLYLNVEPAQPSGSDVNDAMRIICRNIAQQAKAEGSSSAPLLESLVQKHLGENVPGAAFSGILTDWAMQSDKPCVLIIDEVDSLVGNTLISLLRQVRAGYTQRPNAFPQSIVLCGVRDVKDYRIHTSGEVITGGSAFNIKAESLRIGNFTEQELELLFAQHTKATGQPFDPAIFKPLWCDTKGQPWLVNALGDEMVRKEKRNRDRSKTITLEDYRAARERVIHSRATHLDQLSDKLKEPRVKAVLLPILEGDESTYKTACSLDDLQYVEDLGLIDLKPQLSISNDIYKEVIPRELSYPVQVKISHQQAWYVDDDNRLNMSKLLTAFQQFFRENSGMWLGQFCYQEVAPQLLAQAFFQRVVDGGGRITREYALGRKRIDLLVEWPISEQGFVGPVQRFAIELKVLKGEWESCVTAAVKQVLAYGDICNADECHVLLFDRDDQIRWRDKIWKEVEYHDGEFATVWAC